MTARAREVARELIKMAHFYRSPVTATAKAEAMLLLFAREAVAAETERCAKVAETLKPVGHDSPAQWHEIAAAIRDRTTGEAGR